MAGYWNDINPKEVREVLANERDCFRTRAEADAALEAQGRFKRQNETRITGSGGAPTYPAQPATSPWADNPVPPGDAIDKLGFDINEVEPVLADADPDNGLAISPVAVEREPEATEVTATPVASPHTAALKPFKRRF